MEVAFFTESYVPTRDGVASVVSALARAVERLGHPVRVYTPNPVHGAPGERVEIDGVSVIRTRSIPVPVYTQYTWALFPFRSLLGDGFGRDVDVIHLHTPGIMGSTAFLASRRWRKPLLGTFHTNVWDARESFEGRPLIQLFLRIAWWYSLGTYYRCDIATAPTEVARRSLIEHAAKPFRRPIEVVPNGIEVDRFHPGISVPDWRTRCGLSSAPLLTYLGRLTADKGVHRFLDAVESMDGRREFSAIIGGAGPEEAAVRGRILENPRLSSRVRYVGPVTEAEKPALLAQSDLFVLPSTADTSSIALLEAMASGVACIASNEGGPADLLVNGETGRLVSVREPEALPAAISSLLDDRDARRRLAAGGLRWVRETASIEATARRFISLYELLLSERGPRAPRLTV